MQWHGPETVFVAAQGCNLYRDTSTLRTFQQVSVLTGDARFKDDGDDETWLNAVRTGLPCKPYEIVNSQYHGDPRHSGNYTE